MFGYVWLFLSGFFSDSFFKLGRLFCPPKGWVIFDAVHIDIFYILFILDRLRCYFTHVKLIVFNTRFISTHSSGNHFFLQQLQAQLCFIYAAYCHILLDIELLFDHWLLHLRPHFLFRSSWIVICLCQVLVPCLSGCFHHSVFAQRFLLLDSAICVICQFTFLI